jgi:hypothetical protein
LGWVGGDDAVCLCALCIAGMNAIQQQQQQQPCQASVLQQSSSMLPSGLHTCGPRPFVTAVLPAFWSDCRL